MLLAQFVVVSMAVNAVTIGDYEVRLDKTNKNSTKCSGSATNVDIPNSVTYEGNTYSVKSLGNFCSVCCSLTSIAIPESVTSLGNSCFQGCSSPKSVTCELSNQ